MADTSIPYRRLTDPLMLPVGTSSQLTQVPAGFIPTDATSFRYVNNNAFWVRLKGFSGPGAASGTISASEGWLFAPYSWGEFSTQKPEYMATIAFGAGAGSGVIEISYGIGGSGQAAAITSSGGGASGNVTVTNFPALQQVADNGASLTIDTPQLPSTLGTKVGSGSLSVTPASDGVFATLERGSPTLTTGQVQVNNTTAVQVVAARTNRRKVTLAPSSQFTYFVGNSGVTATTGFAVLNGGSITLDTTAAVFVIAQSTGPMTFMEIY